MPVTFAKIAIQLRKFLKVHNPLRATSYLNFEIHLRPVCLTARFEKCLICTEFKSNHPLEPPTRWNATMHNGRSWQVAYRHRSITPKFVTPTALSCIDNSWRSPSTKLTSSTANLEWCHVHFIRDSYSTFIRRVIGPSKNSMELFCKAKFDFKSTWNRDSATSHHKNPVCQSPVGRVEKLTNFWSRYFGTNRIIDNWHRCLGVMWRKQKKYFDE